MLVPWTAGTALDLLLRSNCRLGSALFHTRPVQPPRSTVSSHKRQRAAGDIVEPGAERRSCFRGNAGAAQTTLLLMFPRQKDPRSAQQSGGTKSASVMIGHPGGTWNREVFLLSSDDVLRIHRRWRRLHPRLQHQQSAGPGSSLICACQSGVKWSTRDSQNSAQLARSPSRRAGQNRWVPSSFARIAP